MKILSPYRIPVGITIDVNKPLKIPKIEVKLTNSKKSKPIDTGGIEVGECTKIGKHSKNFNSLPWK